MFRTILGVIVGFVAWSMAWLAGGQFVQRVFPGAVGADGSSSNVSYLLALIVLSILASLAAGFLARSTSASRKITPELVLGVLLLIAGVGIETGYWEQLPLWYHATFLVLLFPVTLLGGRLGARR